MDKIIEKIIINKKLNKHQKLSNILKYICIDICKIDQSKYMIIASYGLREYRNINDIDMNMDNDEFLKLEEATKLGLGSLEFYNGQIRWKIDLTNTYNKLTKSHENDFSIECFMKDSKIGFPNNNFSLNKLSKNGGLENDFNGHQYFSLKTLLKWKKTMNREKDKPDIELISNIFKEKK